MVKEGVKRAVSQSSPTNGTFFAVVCGCKSCCRIEWWWRDAVDRLCKDHFSPGMQSALYVSAWASRDDFAAQAVEGGRGDEHCPELNDENRAKLSGCLAGFVFD